ncbi:MAG TPA: glutathione S-transferase family protein [Candidatus Binatia bacterium]|nr:glutathione S-transferase family protein [Candidatus Binatia bacterium]
MAIKLYHDVPSTNCDRVKIVMAEKGLSWEGIWVKLGKMEQKSPEHLKRNPYGKIPVIDDDGKLLFESCIINEYLDEKYPNPPLQPKDPYLRARGRILVDYFLNYLHEPYWALRGEMIKKNEAERDQKLIAETRKEVIVRLQYLEDALGDKPFFLGDYGLTDIAMLPRFPRLEQYGVLPSPSLPKLSAWFERMKQRPAVQTVL